jgi:hypothetical protein
METMKLALAVCLTLVALACKDPNSYEPFDPTMPDPPAPPVLTSPANGWLSPSFAYPQDVYLSWTDVAGVQFYQLQVTRDSLFRNPGPDQRVYQTSITVTEPTYGYYFWRVRAASRNWNNYTDWSAPFRFGLPNPAR